MGMQRCESEGDESGGSGMGRYVITEQWSQRGIKMFQTNITPPPRALSWSNALQHRMFAFEQMREYVRQCFCFLGVSACVEPRRSGLVVSESVVPGCHRLQGAWLCVFPSPPLCFQSLLPLSWVQLNTCSSSRHSRPGRGS